MGEEIAFENGRISDFQGLTTLTLDRVIVYHHASLIDLYLHTKFHWNQRNFLWTDGRMDGHFRPSLLGPLGGVDLIIPLSVSKSTSPLLLYVKCNFDRLYNHFGFCPCVCLCVCLSTDRLSNDYVRNSLSIFTKFCMPLRNVVVSNAIVSGTNQK